MWRYKQQRQCWMRTRLMVRTLFRLLEVRAESHFEDVYELNWIFRVRWMTTQHEWFDSPSKREVQKEKILAFIKQEVPRIIVASGFPAFLCLHLHWNLLSPVIVASMSLLGAESFTHFSKAARYIIMVFRCIGCWLLAKSASGSIFFLLLFLVASLG